jgi:hypothetical protein
MPISVQQVVKSIEIVHQIGWAHSPFKERPEYDRLELVDPMTDAEHEHAPPRHRTAARHSVEFGVGD